MIRIVGHVDVCSAMSFLLFHMLPLCLPSFYGYVLSVSLAVRLPGAWTISVPHLQHREVVGALSSSCGSSKNTQTGDCSSSSHHVATYFFSATYYWDSSISAVVSLISILFQELKNNRIFREIQGPEELHESSYQNT